MKTPTVIALAPLCLAGAAAMVYSFATAHAWTQHVGRDAVPDASQELHGEKLTRLEGGASIVVDASLLPVVVTQQGDALRPTWVGVQYWNRVGLIGEARVHKLIPASSTETLDLSPRDLDLALGDPQATQGTYRSFQVTVAPVVGRNWGTARSFDDDLTIEASFASR